MFYKECDGKWVWVGLCVQKSNNVYIIINYKGVLTHKATERERERESYLGLYPELAMAQNVFVLLVLKFFALN